MINERISVVLPVVQTGFAKNLMIQMSNNTIPPSEVIVIDDSDSGFSIPGKLVYRTRYVRTERRAEVNISINYGIYLSRESDFVVIGNDDVIIHDHLFELILKAFKDNERFGAVTQKQVKDPKDVGFDAESKYHTMRMREGAVVTFRKNVLDKIPPIPEELKIFFADDWWWNHLIRMGYLWGRIESSRIYHYESFSFNQRSLNRFMESDRKAFMRIEGGRVKLPKKGRV